jgi:hypothetical protein
MSVACPRVRGSLSMPRFDAKLFHSSDLQGKATRGAWGLLPKPLARRPTLFMKPRVPSLRTYS